MKKSNLNSTAADVFGQFLKAKREKAGLTQKQVAAHLGYSTPQFISSWERAEREPPMAVIWKLSSLYGVSAEKIFSVVLEHRQQMIEHDLRSEFLAAKPRSTKAR